MAIALGEAEAAARDGEVPVGAAVVDAEGRLLAACHNEIEARADPTAHAERLALSAACRQVGAPRLPSGSLLVATLEPCAMCAGAIVLARVDFLLFGTPDPKTGACGSLRDIVRDQRLNHRVTLLPGLEGERCSRLLVDFFRARRPLRRDDG